jgi:sugar phosphate permease
MTNSTKVLVPETPALTAAYRKVSRRLLPLLFICMIISYVDRVNVGFAKLQMQEDLALSAAAFGLGAGIFFIAYVTFEIPSNLLLTKIGTRTTLIRIMIAWGIVSMATGFAWNEVSFYVLRFLLGMFEAGFAPAVLLYLTLWFSPRRRARAFAIFLSAVAMAGVIGGPISGLILENLDETLGLHGWQWMFIIEGFPAVALGVILIWALTNSPSDAKWLTEAEKTVLIADVAANATTEGQTHSFGAAIRRPQVYLLGFIYFALLCGVYLISFWLPTIISQLSSEFSESEVGYITAIPYIAAVIAMILLGRSSDRRNEQRWHVAISATIGIAALLSTMIIQDAVLSIVMFTIATAGIFAAFPIFWSIPPRFFTGIAAAGSIALINSMGTFSGFVSPFIAGVVTDLTGNLNAVLVGMAAVVVIALLVMFRIVPKEASIASPELSSAAAELTVTKTRGK